MPASLWAKSTMTTRAPEPEQVEPARRALGRRAEVEQAVARPASIDAPRPARAAGRRQGVGDVVPGQPADRDRDSGDLDDLASPVAVGLDQRRRRGRGRRGRRRARWRRTIGGAVAGIDEERDLPRTRRATAATSGSSALRTTQPSGLVIRQIVALTSASSGRVWMPCRSRWSDETLVRTLASFDS